MLSISFVALMHSIVERSIQVLSPLTRSSFFQKLPVKFGNMQTLEQVIENNKRSAKILSSLQTEFSAIKNELCIRRKRELIKENANLQRQIDVTKAKLIALEIKNGKRQIPVPSENRSMCTDATIPNVAQSKLEGPSKKGAPSDAHKSSSAGIEEAKAPKEKKSKKEKPVETIETIDVGRLDMRVGRIINVERHPDADSLYLEKIDCGEPQPRTVVSGLVKFVPLEEMQNRMVIVLCNLKPAKMRGVTSEAMVMCASTPEKVEVLSPPVGAVPGDLVHCEGFSRNPDAQLNPKKKIFETCAPDLMTNRELVACYKGAPLHVPGKGKIVAQTLRNVNVK